MFEPAEIPATVIPREQPARSGPVPGTVPGTRPARPPREPLDLSVLLGARALAWTGGAVTLLGVVFFARGLAKLFVYDLAVGGLILVAGFFYQRLAGGRQEARA